jgi:hypothetical protein
LNLTDILLQAMGAEFFCRKNIRAQAQDKIDDYLSAWRREMLVINFFLI